MSKPAAALGDVAAHGGALATGSSNVLIGGRPAARVGDTIICPLHGPGVVSLGSFTVLINGMPAGRMGDITGCMTPSMAPVSVPLPVLGPPPVPSPFAPPTGTPAAPMEWARSMAHGKDGKFHEENDKSKDGVSAMHIEGRITDANSDGHLDTIEGGLENFRMRNKGAVQAGPIDIGLTNSADILFANAKGSYLAAPGAAEGGSVSASAEAGMLKWGVGASAGARDSKGLNQGVGIGGEVSLFHAKAEGDLLIGDDGNRVGLIGKGEAGAEVLKGEVSTVFTSPSIAGGNIQLTPKGAAAAGGVGGGAGAWLYYDKKQARLHIGIAAKFVALFGLEGEVGLSIGKMFSEDAPAPPPAPPAAAPLAGFGGYANSPGLGAAGLPGTILLGNPTVLIGG